MKILLLCKDQTIKLVGKCVDGVVLLSSADRLFLRCSLHSQSQPEAPICSSSGMTAVSETAAGYMPDSSSTLTDQSQSSAASKFVQNLLLSLNQNR